MAEGNEVTGRCLCGAVTFKTKATSHEVHACHCSMCRRWTGGPLMYIHTEGAPAITGADQVSIFRSSDAGERGFCKTCGSILFWKVAGEDQYAFMAGALDDASGLVLTREIFIDDKPAFYDFANETVKVTGADWQAASASREGIE